MARFLEGGGSGEPAESLIQLSSLLPEGELHRVPAAVAQFYSNPLAFSVRAGVNMTPASRLVFGLFAWITRQTCINDSGPAFEDYPVAQFLYRDRRGRLHWDRYVCAGQRWRRLFLARVETRAKLLHETFVICGLPVTLRFRAVAETDGLRLTLAPSWKQPWAYLLDVSYRTASFQRGIRTLGDFRVRLLNLRVQTEFRMVLLPEQHGSAPPAPESSFH